MQVQTMVKLYKVVTGEEFSISLKSAAFKAQLKEKTTAIFEGMVQAKKDAKLSDGSSVRMLAWG